ncbi:hypothetical protein GF406_21235 [candidate division KSB1 bacterium]|nr:hypothetical protein [candidate division KSB1 bacterium]
MQTKWHSTVSILMLLALWGVSQAQSLGLEMGAAAVENFSSPPMNYGFSADLLLTDHVLCNVSLNVWNGQDVEYTKDMDTPTLWSDRTYFGNSGLNFSLYYKVFSTTRSSVYLGSGLGRHEMIRLSRLHTKTSFPLATFLISARLDYNIAKRISVYAKSSMNTRDLNEHPAWGLVNMGIKYTL